MPATMRGPLKSSRYEHLRENTDRVGDRRLVADPFQYGYDLCDSRRTQESGTVRWNPR
jgi:hypothetical protein